MKRFKAPEGSREIVTGCNKYSILLQVILNSLETRERQALLESNHKMSSRLSLNVITLNVLISSGL